MTDSYDLTQRSDAAPLPEGAIAVVARVTARCGLDQKLFKVTRELEQQVRQHEPKNLFFRAHRSADVPGVVLFYEVFEDRIGLEAHKAAPHLKQWFEAITELVSTPVDVLVCQPLAAEVVQ